MKILIYYFDLKHFWISMTFRFRLIKIHSQAEEKIGVTDL